MRSAAGRGNKQHGPVQVSRGRGRGEERYEKLSWKVCIAVVHYIASRTRLGW